MKEALDWNVSGCCENRLPNRETNVTGYGGINYGSVVELTFRNGASRCSRTSSSAWRPAIRGLDDFRRCLQGILRPAEHLARHAHDPAAHRLAVKPDTSPRRQRPCCTTWPWPSVATCTPTATCFPGAIDHARETMGKGTAIDSLAAVKHLIYDTKRLTWDQLLTAMEANWEGHEVVRQMCLKAPKLATTSSGWIPIGLRHREPPAGVSAQHPSRTVRPSCCVRSRSRSMFRWAK